MPTQQNNPETIQPKKPVAPLNQPIKKEVERKFIPEGDEKGQSELEKGNETQLPTPNRNQELPRA